MGFFSGSVINPVIPPPIWSQLQTDMGLWLLQQFKGDGSIMGVDELKKYPGATSPDITKTMLPSVWDAWDSTNPAYAYLQDQAKKTQSQVGQTDPMLSHAISWGALCSA